MEKEQQIHLIAGLGNPGKRYENTRHNLGFMVVDALARKYEASFEKDKKFKGEVVSLKIGGARVELLKPATYMNLSGEAVKAMVDFYKIPLENTLVVVDDSEIPFGKIRIRGKGSCGGHRGLENIEMLLGSGDYPRMRVGIGRPQPGEPLENYVLRSFFPEEEALLPQLIDGCLEAISIWLKENLTKAAVFAGSFQME